MRQCQYPTVQWHGSPVPEKTSFSRPSRSTRRVLLLAFLGSSSPSQPLPSLTLQRRRERGRHEGEKAAQGAQALRAGAGDPRRQVPVSALDSLPSTTPVTPLSF